ncbi:hypothetical protein VTI28DRAFT_4858 [Corynascus sepedonium]
MASTREILIQSAISDVQNGLCSQKDAAKKYSIPQSTLNRRLHGAHPRQLAKVHEQRLGPVQEKHVVDWCLKGETSGRAPSRVQVIAFAQTILAEGGDHKPLGARWIDRFLRRNNAVKTKKSARSIISGSRNTGIWSLDPSKVSEDSEAVLESQAFPARPETPSPTPGTEIWTPQKSQDIRVHQQGVREGREASERLTRTLLAKAGKALDAKNAEIASLKAQIDHLTKEIEAYEPQTRRRVKENANNRLARAEDIIQSEGDDMNSSKRKKRKTQQSSHAVEKAEEIIVCG